VVPNCVAVVSANSACVAAATKQISAIADPYCETRQTNTNQRRGISGVVSKVRFGSNSDLGPRLSRGPFIPLTADIPAVRPHQFAPIRAWPADVRLGADNGLEPEIAQLSKSASSGQQVAVAPRSRADQYGETGPVSLAQDFDFGEETNTCS